ncbi:MAG: inositol 2-dehydrogenase [Albidovulum sp.]|nr:inositol 2-dehydrogenase [Albidovulum sp.]MDE0532169.1 inositol 2-dehydrogenase [Albidovulum sp.]
MVEIPVALIGCGRIGWMHAANIASHPKLKLSAVHDVHAPSAEKLSAEFGVQAYSTAEGIFSNDSIKAVLVASTTDTHVDFIERSVAAGKPVLCEKPIDLDIARVNQCAKNLEGSDIPVQIGFNRRFDPGHAAASKASRSGEIGELRQVFITSRDPEMPTEAYYRTAGGLMRDMTIHDFDLARFFLVDEPVEVFAIGGRLIDPEFMEELGDHDTAMITMRTEDGKQCHINNFRLATYGYDQRIELVGSDGMVISGNRKPHELQRFSKARTESSEPYMYFFIERYTEAFAAELSEFADCIESGKAPSPGFEDGRRALLLAETAYRSIAERRLVRVAEVE